MRHAGFFALTLLTALPLAAVGQQPPAVVVLKDGTCYELAKPYEVRGSQVRLSLAKGPPVSIPSSEIDLEATRLAALPPTPTPTPPPPANPTPSSTLKKGSFSDARGTALQGAYSGPFANTSYSSSRPKTELVSGYTRADGKYVAPYTRASPSTARKK